MRGVVLALLLVGCGEATGLIEAGGAGGTSSVAGAATSGDGNGGGPVGGAAGAPEGDAGKATAQPTSGRGGVTSGGTAGSASGDESYKPPVSCAAFSACAGQRDCSRVEPTSTAGARCGVGTYTCGSQVGLFTSDGAVFSCGDYSDGCTGASADASERCGPADSAGGSGGAESSGGSTAGGRPSGGSAGGGGSINCGCYDKYPGKNRHFCVATADDAGFACVECGQGLLDCDGDTVEPAIGSGCETLMTEGCQP